jgi:protein involved in polysaccharide export with SLBB domain
MKKNFLVFYLVLFFTGVISAQSGTVQPNTSLGDLSSVLSGISVTIGGSFIVNGTFPAAATERVDQFVTRIYNQAKIENLSLARDGGTFKMLQEQFGDYAKRHIKLVSQNGEVRYLDLLKFRLTGDYSQNPYLKNGDVLIFPKLDLERNFVEINGAVNNPTKFQFVEGDKLSDAILFAQGINKAYDNVRYAEISRLNADGTQHSIIKVKISDDVPLKVGDRIRILAEETYRKDYYVTVEGEVKTPGTIFITKDSTTIYDVIKEAGGFTPKADLANALILRGNYLFNTSIRNTPQEILRRQFFSNNIDLMMMQRMANISQEDSLFFLVDNRLRLSRGNINVDFTKVLDPTSKDSKVLVRNGDYIYVPKKQNLVYVFGQVMNPGYTEYKPGEKYDYYIRLAGGLGKTARGDVYLIKNKTRAWIELTEEENYEIEPGDLIWAPKSPYRDFDYYLQRVSTYTSIVGSIATVILLIYQMMKK